MGANVVPQRRNLRRRKPWGADELGAAPPRRLRQSRAKLSAGDLLVFDNEEDADFEERASLVDAEEEEIEEIEPAPRFRHRPGRLSARSSRRQEIYASPSPYAGRREILRQRQLEREREHERMRERAREQLSARSRSKAKARLSSGAAPSSASGRSRTRRSRHIIHDEQELEPEFNGDELGDSGDELDDDLEEEDENGYDSELGDDVVLNSHQNSRKSRNIRKPIVLLPEDVFGRELQPDQPEQDPEDVRYSPSVAFIAIFVATFIDVFPDLATLPCPQDIEEGLIASTPSELVEYLFRRLLGLVLNRKKELEVGRYGSALSELHSLRNTLGMGSYFPALNWKSKGNAFAELSWMDRAEILHVLAHWSLASSDRIRQLLKNLDESSTMPWMGVDEKGAHYYIVGFDPLAEGSSEYTRFRVYKETNRLLATVKWEPIASNSYEVAQFLRQHEIKPESDSTKPEIGEAQKPELEDTKIFEETNQTEATKKEAAEADNVGSTDAKEASETDACAANVADAAAQIPAAPPVYDLPDSVVQILNEFLPLMQTSEKISMGRYEREAKRARRKRDMQFHSENIVRRERQYTGRLRRRRTNYSDYLRDAYGGLSDDESDSQSRKRRLRNRGDDYAWKEPEPETREQRHARLLAERTERELPEATLTPAVTPIKHPDHVEPTPVANEVPQLGNSPPEPAQNIRQYTQPIPVQEASQAEEPLYQPPFDTPIATSAVLPADNRMNLNSIMQSSNASSPHELVPSLRTAELPSEALPHEITLQLPSMQSHWNDPEHHF